MSARVWKFLSNTIGKLQSPRTAQQNDNVNNSPSLRQIESNPDTPTRHGNGNNVGEESANAGLSKEQDDSVLDTPLNEKISNIKEKLEEAVKPITKDEAEDEAEEDVTAESSDNIEAGEAAKSTKRSVTGKAVVVPPPRQGRNKRGGSAEKVETLAHTEVPVENTRKTRGRGRPAKNTKTVVQNETIVSTTHEESNSMEEEEVAELLVKNELSVDDSTTRKPRGRGRPSKPKVYAESNQSEAEIMAEEVETSNSNNNPNEKTHTHRSKRPLLPKVADQVHVPEPSIDTPPIANNKRRRDVLESSVGTEEAEMDSSASVSNKRRKTSARPEGPGIPPIGTTREAKDERRKYMDRERQRRCRQRKKDRQQGLQAAEREVLAQAKDERKKAMARERVRRHRDNQRQKQGVEVETKASGRQRTREEARQRDRELIASGGRSGASNSVENESFSE
ncbi:uncharacterized protein EAF01_011439 [Botrytis porri]|uniref:Uncharacterized protein n=1 Tax=Botrytis porri TaxID=87229 RepID=A0A4Z1KVJ7_9HELO|nr:uncharacterized protein EAF01_011439 [Botrytis porri]KAF7885374.1 hypothetical protein EAF01_011439 [Botrytis porri]TGO88537.1 hypothetical protein BPOR_0156g00040 [Botrytis porri]